MIDGLQQTNISLNKGIVRTPSLGEEGELSECVNLIPHAGEIVRIHEPQPLTEEIVGQYVYYTIAWEQKGAGSTLTFAKSQPLREDLPFKVHYLASPGLSETTQTVILPSGNGSVSVDFPNLARLDDITSIDVGDEASVRSVEDEGYAGLRAYHVFEWEKSSDIKLPSEDDHVILPFELQPGEILMETNRCAGKENYIVRNGKTLVYYRLGEGRHHIADLDTEDLILTTFGQTLVVSLGASKRYFVWEDKGYVEQNPLSVAPEIEFTLGDPVENWLNSDALYLAESEIGKLESGSFINNAIIRKSEVGYKTPGSNLGSQEQVADGNACISASIKFLDEDAPAAYNIIRARWKKYAYFCFPFYVRTAVELYDGSITHLGPPILITPSTMTRPYFGVHLPISESDPRSTYHSSIVPILTPRALFIHIKAKALRSVREELIKGILIYATPEIEVMSPKLSYGLGNRTTDGAETDDKLVQFQPVGWLVDGQGTIINRIRATSQWEGGYEVNGGGKFLGRFNFVWLPPVKEDVKEDFERYTNPSEFYLLKKISYQELLDADFELIVTPGTGYYEDVMPPMVQRHTPWVPNMKAFYYRVDREYTQLSRGGIPMLTSLPDVLTNLTSQPTLSKVTLAQTEVSVSQARANFEYNARLIMGNFSDRPNLPNLANAYLADCRTRAFRVKQNPGWGMGIRVGDLYKAIQVHQDFYSGFSPQFAYIAAPGNRPKEIAFSFGGPNKNLETKVTLAKGIDAVGDGVSWCKMTIEWLYARADLKELYPKPRETDFEWGINNYDKMGALNAPNKIAVTRAANPWVIETVQELSCGEIYAISAATEALSEGQFGEFPMYAFTDRGIYALSISPEGNISAKQAISREVLYSNGSVLQIDRAVVFPTASGLGILSGRSASVISNSIAGPNVDEDAFNSPPELSIRDVAPFQSQISTSQMVFDYASRSAHLFSPSEAVPLSQYDKSWTSIDVPNEREEVISDTYVEVPQRAFNFGLSLVYNSRPSPEGPRPAEFIIEGFSYNKDADLDIALIIPLKEGEELIITRGVRPGDSSIRTFKHFAMEYNIGDGYVPEETRLPINVPITVNREYHFGFERWDTPLSWYVKTKGSTTITHTYYTQSLHPVVEEQYRQKHYVYDLESGQWATQILDRQLTTCVAGYPFSTMQFGRQLMQYTNELEADIVKPGWLLTRPVSFNDPFTRKMLADIRVFGQKTHPDTKFRVQVYVSEDRLNWHRLTSLKGRSAKWYRFLILADMCGLDTLSGIACQYVPRLGNKLR